MPYVNNDIRDELLLSPPANNVDTREVIKFIVKSFPLQGIGMVYHFAFKT